MIKTKRILIAGARFGELYLNHFIEPQPGLELAGLLSTGSERSRALAGAFGVPHYSHTDALPNDIDIACVVVRASVIGGPGNVLTEQLLRRGIHVLQEHPVSASELQRHLQLAAECHAEYRVNSFYGATPAGRCFIQAAQHLAQQQNSLPLYATLTTSRQLLYSALDILLQALAIDGQNNRLTPTLLAPQGSFDLLQLSSSDGQRYLLQLQNYLDPRDPDMHSLAMHQLVLGWSAGYLSLTDSHGPVSWSPVLHADNHLHNNHSLYQSALDTYQQQPASRLLYAGQHQVQDGLENLGPAGVGHTLSSFCQLIAGQPVSVALQARHQQQVAELWEQILALVGAPQEHSLAAPAMVDMDALQHAATAHLADIPGLELQP